MKIDYVSVDEIKGADYNPRKIADDKIDELAKSINDLGFILPILVNKSNNIIIAGHQRTKTARKIGIEKVPAFFINNMSISDEINFNQIHNGSEYKLIKPSEIKNGYEKEKYIEIEPDDLIVYKDYINMSVVNSLCLMINKYGNVFLSIACKNKILFQNEYAYACKILNIKCNAYICSDEKFEKVKEYFSKQYGEYYYDNIKKTTFVQGLAQLNRNTDKNSNKDRRRSILYEDFVFQFLKNNRIETILDFGCGKGAYINLLKKKGYKGIGVEFYNNNKKSIDVIKGNKQIDDLINYLKKSNTFDLVICDSVLNSVDSMKAQLSVMDCLNLFSKDYCFISGITLNKAKQLNKSSANRRVTSKLRFFDKNNFTASFRNGKWYFQKYHDKKDVYELAEKSGFKVLEYQVVSGSFKALLIKNKQLSTQRYKEAINFEFNLPLPNNKSYNRHKDVLKVLNLI